MTTVAAEFDRSNPLFERNVVSFEVVTTPPNNNNTNASSATNNNNNNNKRNGNFTVRILEGRRSTSSSGGEGERVIRFEMSNECNLVVDSLPAQQQQCTPSRSSRTTPIIHAPFMTADRGGEGQGGHHSTMMQGPTHHQSPHTRLQPQQKLLNLPIELYELEVGESDFAALRRDQALLVDFSSFSDSLISLLQCCELGNEENEGGCSSTHQQTFQDTNSNQYGQQQPYDESASGGWNGSGQGVGAASRQSTKGQQQYQWGSSNNAWSTPSHQQQGMNYHGQRMMSSPFAKMNCPSTSMPVSTYACRLEIDASSNNTSSMQQWRQNSTQQSNNNSMRHARFSIVESNQFRELTHLALNLNVGTDKSVRCYLSSRYVYCRYVDDVCLVFISLPTDSLPLLLPNTTHNRLSQTMLQTKSIEAMYVEQQRRSDTAETNLVRLNKRLQDLTQSSEVEKNQIRYQAEERLQAESSTLLAEAKMARAAKEEEIKALNDRNDKNRLILENKIELLSSTNAKLNSDKMAIENENERLATKLSYTETTNSTLTNEVTTLQSRLKQVSEEKKTIEQSLHQLQLELSSLAQSNDNQERTISQAEAQRLSAEQVSSNAKQTLSRQQSQLEELKRRLEEAELETSKYKDLTSRYQTNRLEMKKRIKEKVEMIREQEDVLIVKEKETTDLKCRVKSLEEELHKSQTEKSTMSRDLSTAKKQAEDDKKKLENNQQVSSCLSVSVYCLSFA